MATGKTAKTAKATTVAEVPCPECGKPTRVIKRLKDRSQGIAGGMFRACTACTHERKL